MGMHDLSCLLLAVDFMEVSLIVDYVSLLSSGPDPEDCWELLLGSLDLQDAGKSGTDYGIGLSTSCWTAGWSFMAAR